MHIILFRFVPLRPHSCSLIVLDPGAACAEQFSYCACRLDPSVDVRLLEWWTSPTFIFSEGSTSLPGGNQVDGLPPASSLETRLLCGDVRGLNIADAALWSF